MYLVVNFIINGTNLSLLEINLLLFIASALISFASFFYPLNLRFKDSEYESAIVIAFLFPVLHVGLHVFVINNGFEVFNDISAGFVHLGSSVIMFVISYFISKIFYGKTELWF